MRAALKEVFLSPVPPFAGKTRAYLEFLAAVIYYLLAHSTAHRAALQLAGEEWVPLVEQALLVALLIAIYALFGRFFDREPHPIADQGLPLRPGWPGEWAMGVAVGWGAAVVCVIALALMGGIAIVLTTDRAAWIALLGDLLFFAIAALVEEVAFRGYGFQRFRSVVGPVGAIIGFAAFYAGLQALQPGSGRASVTIAFTLSMVLSIAYLRTRALWLSWGLNFAWKASRALIFGLAVSGVSSHSSVVEGDPMGPFWLTGGGYGLDGSWIAFFVLLGTLPFIYRMTRDLNFHHNAPVIEPGGMPVDLDSTVQRQHDAYMGSSQPAPSPLVQILPAAPPAAPPDASNEIGSIVTSEPDGPR